MDTVRLTAMQRYYLEALGHQGRLRFGANWDAIEGRLAYCWYASGFAGKIQWERVRDIAKRSWNESAARPREETFSAAARTGALRPPAGKRSTFVH